jgi:uncharacterized protein (TIGR03437 family)
MEIPRPSIAPLVQCIALAILALFFLPQNASTQTIYVANAADNTLTAVNAVTNSVTATIPIEVSPLLPVSRPNSTILYIATAAPVQSGQSAGNAANSIIAFDTSSNAIVATTRLPAQTLTASPDGASIYVGTSNSLTTIDTQTNSVSRTFTAQSLMLDATGVRGVAVSPDSSTIYLTYGGGVAAIASQTGQSLWLLHTQESVYSIVLSPDGHVAYAAANQSIYVVDVSAHAVITTIPIDTITAPGLAINPAGTALYLVAEGPNSASDFIAISTASNTVVATMAFGRTIFGGLAVSPDGKRIYVSLYSSHAVAVFDAATNGFLSYIFVGNQPAGIAIQSPPSLQITTTSLPNGVSGQPYSTTLTASQGSGTNPVWSIASGSLPSGFLLSPAGRITSSGIPAAAPGSYVFSVQVTDSAGESSARQFTFLVTPSSTLAPPPSISAGGIVPVFSTVSIIQPGSWISIYGTNLATGTASWNGDFPQSLLGTSVTINGNPAALWYVSAGQINLQAPDDTTTGIVTVVVTTPSGTATSTVTLAQFGPSLSLLDSKHVAGIIPRSDGSGSNGGGTYDIIGPAGTSLGYKTVPAKAGDTLVLFGVGFGPTNPIVASGKLFSGSAPTTNTVQFLVNGTIVLPFYSGLTSAGLYQFNLVLPAGLGTGDVTLQAAVGGVRSPSGVVLSLQ